MRLIDSDALIGEINERIKSAYKWYDETPTDEIKTRAEQAIATFCEASLTVRKMPTIEPERKKGEWVNARDGYDGHVKCNNCFKTYDWDSQAQYYNFCPNCGADMRGE